MCLTASLVHRASPVLVNGWRAHHSATTARNPSRHGYLALNPMPLTHPFKIWARPERIPPASLAGPVTLSLHHSSCHPSGPAAVCQAKSRAPALPFLPVGDHLGCCVGGGAHKLARADNPPPLAGWQGSAGSLKATLRPYESTTLRAGKGEGGGNRRQSSLSRSS